MAEDIVKVNKVSAATKSAVARKSAQTLPNRPSEQGYSAEEIKRRFYQPIIDAANSALAEIDRVVGEVNAALSQVDVFIDDSELKAPYKMDIDNSTWSYNNDAKRYEFQITQEMHKIEDYKELAINMYLVDADGKLISVKNYEVYTNGTVNFYNENTGGGFVSISRNRDGFVKGDVVTDVDNIIGIAKVAKTNQYDDLDGKPDLSKALQNEVMISGMLNGSVPVGKAENADNAANADYATNAGSSNMAGSAATATRAMQDDLGENIRGTYAKQNGSYSALTAGKSNLADKAKADEDNVNIKANYAKKSGVYKDLTAGSVDITNITNALYPVGSIRFTTTNVNPGTYLTGTTWVAWGSGRVPVGVNASDTEFATAEQTGGEKTHKLLASEMPSHDHALRGDMWTVEGNTAPYNTPGSSTGNTSIATANRTNGGDKAHNNLQPYITCYMWKRTA